MQEMQEAWNASWLIIWPRPMIQSHASIHCPKKTTSANIHKLLSKLGRTHRHQERNYFAVSVLGALMTPLGLNGAADIAEFKSTPDKYPPKSKALEMGSSAGHSLAHARRTSMADRWRFGSGPDGPSLSESEIILGQPTKHARLGNPVLFLGVCVNQACS